MSSATPAVPRLSATRRVTDRIGDRVLLGLTVGASVVAIAVLVLIVYKLVAGASGSISKFGLAFLWHSTWNTSTSPGVRDANVFGAGTLVFGTIVTSGLALLFAVPLGIGIGVYLSLLAPGRVSAVVGPLVELLAAVPSVIIGLWGIIVLAPFMRSTIQPALHDALGWIPIFGAPSTTGLGIFTASIALGLMVLPIMSAVSRDLFLSVPRELKDGALALGMTRWEMIRGVVLDSSRAGLAAATILGLSRALGEAIAVTQLIESGSSINANLFGPGDTLASRIPEQFLGSTGLWNSSLFYCAVILLVMELAVNLAAQLIVRRFERRVGLAVR
ncbi:MAG: phosphate ABC transporter permease subunit PstC [Solirubrobacteraceae bacterium]